MPENKSKRCCPVCNYTLDRGSVCPRCRARLDDTTKIFRSSWLLVGAALFFLVALYFWNQRLSDSQTQSSGGYQKKHSLQPLPDGPIIPGEPSKIPFGQETCVPWNISAAGTDPIRENSVLLLTSRIMDPFALTLAGFSEACRAGQPSLIIEDLKGTELPEILKKKPPTAVVAVGLEAVRLAQQELDSIPVFFAKIQNPIEAGMDRANAYGISPWIATEFSMSHLLKVLPRRKPLGILYPQGRIGEQAEAAASMARAEPREVFLFGLPGQGVEAVLSQAALQAQVWVVLTDHQVITPQIFNQIQVMAETHNIPVGVTDEEHVRMGALVGVGPDSYRIGEQLCKLVSAYAANKLPLDKHVFCPEFSFAVIHQTVNEKLGYVVDFQKPLQAKLFKWH